MVSSAWKKDMPLELAGGEIVPHDLLFWFKARLTECLLGLDEDDYAITGIAEPPRNAALAPPSLHNSPPHTSTDS